MYICIYTYIYIYIYKEAYLETSQSSMMEVICKIVNAFCFRKKAPSWMFDWVLNTPLDRSHVNL